MANYTNMVKANKRRSQELKILALEAINEMLEDGVKVEVCSLVRRTGLSRDFFYKNKEVHEAYKMAVLSQTGKSVERSRKEVLDMALRSENRKLREELSKTRKALILSQAELDTLKTSQFDYIENL